MTIYVGYYTHPSWGHIEDDAGAANQQAALVTFPNADTILTLGAWIQSYDNCSTKLCVWNASTYGFVVGTNAFSVGNTGSDARFEAALTTPLNVSPGDQYYIGWAHSSSDAAFIYPCNASGSGTHIEKKQTTWPGSLSGYASQPFQISAYAIMQGTQDLGTLGLNTASAPTVTCSWNACTNPSTASYVVAVCQKTANAYQGFDYNNPSWPDHMAIASVAWAPGTNSVTVNLSGQLYPGDWVLQCYAISSTGSILGQTSGTFPTLTIASPSPYPWQTPGCWFTAAGVLHYTSQWAAWYNAACVPVGLGTIASRWPTAVQVN